MLCINKEMLTLGDYILEELGRKKHRGAVVNVCEIFTFAMELKIMNFLKPIHTFKT